MIMKVIFMKMTDMMVILIMHDNDGGDNDKITNDDGC